MPCKASVEDTTLVVVIGSYLSPYVRKVLVTLHLKRIPYQIDPIVPFYGNDEFSRLSPLRRIPVLLDGDIALCDSTVICEYLEDRCPTPNVLPLDVAARSKARWLTPAARAGWRLPRPEHLPYLWRSSPPCLRPSRHTDRSRFHV